MSYKLQELNKDVVNDHQEIGGNQKKIESLDVQSKQMKQTIESLAEQMKDLKNRDKIVVDKIVDKLFPIGSIHMTFVNIQPPMNGQNGVRWELLPEGYTLMTANAKNVG